MKYAMKKGDTHDVHVEKNEIERFISDLQMIGPDTKSRASKSTVIMSS